jgi:hypothetical protein
MLLPNTAITAAAAMQQQQQQQMLLYRLQQQQQMQQQQARPPPPPPPTHEYHQTATIKNQVNLKKATLRLERVGGGNEGGSNNNAPLPLALRFAFDASAPCRVTTFLHVAEEPRAGCRLVPLPTSASGGGVNDSADADACSAAWACARPPVYYERGLDHQFPPVAGAQQEQQQQAAAAHVVDLSSDTFQRMAALSPPPLPSSPARGGGGASSSSGAAGTPANHFAVVIRLESIAPEEAGAGGAGGAATAPPAPRSLRDAPVGGPLPPWVQAQTTYARLAPCADDPTGWRLVILKQKIWVRGVSYELQEIYGMEQQQGGGGAAAGAAAIAGGVATGVAVGAGGAPGGDDGGRECVICMTNERDTTALPCRHMCMCAECASALKTQTNRCPICRCVVESLLHIKIERRGVVGGQGGPGGQGQGRQQQQQQQQALAAAS